MSIPNTPEPRRIFAVGERVRAISVDFADTNRRGTITELRGTTGYCIKLDDLPESMYFSERELERLSVVDRLAEVE